MPAIPSIESRLSPCWIPARSPRRIARRPPSADDGRVEPAQVIVVERSPDQRTQGIANAVGARDDMVLVGGAVLPIGEVLDSLDRLPAGLCAVICVGSRAAGAAAPVERWLARRGDLVVLDVDLDADSDGAAVRFERFALHDMRLDSMLHALHDLMARSASGERVLHFRLHTVASAPAGGPPAAGSVVAGPVLKAGLHWLHTVLLAAIRARRAPMSTDEADAGEASGDWVGFGVNAAMTEHTLATRGALQAVPLGADMVAAAEELWQALRDDDVADAEPLAAMAHRLALTQLELQLFLLALSPDLDARYQGCMAVLLDDASRRVGTLGLHAGLLGESVAVTRRLLASGGLVRWRLLHDACVLPNADDPLRADPYVRAWLLGARSALEADPRLQRVLRTPPWPGTDLFQAGDRFRASSLVAELCSSRGALCMAMAADSPPYALALLEHGAHLRNVRPLRVDLQRLAELDRAEAAETARRLGRAALLTDRPLVLDASADGIGDAQLAPALSALAATGCRFGVVSADVDAVVRSLGAAPFRLEPVGQGQAERAELFRSALARAGATPDEFSAQFLASNFPLQIDGIAAALRLAQAHAGANGDGPGPRERFIEGCKAIAKQGISHLAEHIEPGFKLDDVVLPRERAEQLHEIVASVRLAPMVLDQWDFKRQLPYGRGTTVLFHGPSGTGKTMAAHGIAKALNVHLLRLDLSRVVSKYIGETEQHCDRVFRDAAQSGAAVLIDEADALFGKRSEVKDAHDRYANIEVAFLLQRIETFEGLAILTTNLRQNLDPAFLRRLRFIVEFPRPDVQARAAIWKSCLPPAAHRVSDEEIGDLARRIDLTGGHIRQITLRAAFLAADRGEQIELRHLLAAGRAELAKLGMPAAGLGTPTLAPARRVA